jgi:hypothetical protein
MESGMHKSGSLELELREASLEDQSYPDAVDALMTILEHSNELGVGHLLPVIDAVVG